MGGVRCLLLAYLKSREAAHADDLARLAAYFGDQFANGTPGVSNERHAEKRKLGLRALGAFGDFALVNVLRVHGRDLQGDVVREGFEPFGPGDKVRLAIQFDEDANAAAVD